MKSISFVGLSALSVSNAVACTCTGTGTGAGVLTESGDVSLSTERSADSTSLNTESP